MIANDVNERANEFLKWKKKRVFFYLPKQFIDHLNENQHMHKNLAFQVNNLVVKFCNPNTNTSHLIFCILKHGIEDREKLLQ